MRTVFSAEESYVKPMSASTKDKKPKTTHQEFKLEDQVSSPAASGKRNL